MDHHASHPRKPRIALMGEFSAGKSTLSNLLIGASPLPTKVTATQLPPVWIAWGDEAPYRMDLDGVSYPLALEDLRAVEHADTALIRIFQKSDILELCDIIDMPGISDPNMDAEVWQRVIGEADGVIWCTHATQAWRQTEAAVWEELGGAIRDRSLLLVTRFDKVVTDRDRRRLMKRVERETDGLFSSILPISLTEAIAGRTDQARWEESGAEAFTQTFIDLIHGISKSLGLDDPMAQSLARQGAALAEVAEAPRPDLFADDPDGAPRPAPVHPDREEDAALAPLRIVADSDEEEADAPTPVREFETAPEPEVAHATDTDEPEEELSPEAIALERIMSQTRVDGSAAASPFETAESRDRDDTDPETRDTQDPRVDAPADGTVPEVVDAQEPGDEDAPRDGIVRPLRPAVVRPTRVRPTSTARAATPRPEPSRMRDLL